jgi:hypothetical protein
MYATGKLASKMFRRVFKKALKIPPISLFK